MLLPCPPRRPRLGCEPDRFGHRRGCGSDGPSRDPARRSPADRLRRRLRRPGGHRATAALPVAGVLQRPTVGLKNLVLIAAGVNGIEAVHVAPFGRRPSPVPLVVAMGPRRRVCTTSRSRTGTIKCATPVDATYTSPARSSRATPSAPASPSRYGSRGQETQAALGPSRWRPASRRDPRTARAARDHQISCPMVAPPVLSSATLSWSGQPPPRAERIVACPDNLITGRRERPESLAAPSRVAGSTNVVSNSVDSGAISRITPGERRGVGDDGAGVAVSGTSANTSTSEKGTAIDMAQSIAAASVAVHSRPSGRGSKRAQSA